VSFNGMFFGAAIVLGLAIAAGYSRILPLMVVAFFVLMAMVVLPGSAMLGILHGLGRYQGRGDQE
jgi:hypothetical protein